MMRLFLFILIFAIFLAFIALNLGDDHACSVSLGFRTFENVPVFFSSLLSFALGMMFTLPLVLSFGRKRKKAESSRGKKKQPSLEPAQSPEIDEIKKESSPYGID
jgi:hypothetical protein